MMNEDDPPRQTPVTATPPLDRLGIAELRVYIAGLQAEIVRAETEITRKDAHRDAADSIFRTH